MEIFEQKKDIVPGTLLILGNGFDLDLGYKTSYKDFLDAGKDNAMSYFPFVRGGYDYNSLGRFLLQHTSIEKWYDLEQLLAEYGESKRGEDASQVEDDKRDYQKLCKGLLKYLLSIDYSKVNKNSVAAKILSASNNCVAPTKIYSFNYTDIYENAKYLGISISEPVYVHGSIKNKDIILGAGEYAKLDKNCDFLYKANQHINPDRLLYDLESYNDIVIFGLSLSKTDYPYFKDFFNRLTKRSVDNGYVRIITKDLPSEESILRNLRNMGTDIIQLKGRNYFDILKTEDKKDSLKIEKLLEHLSSAWELDRSYK